MFTADFLRVAATLYVPSMGTENLSPFLYCLVRMIRPATVLEIGAGYTTLFLAQALVDARAEAAADRQLLESRTIDERTPLLSASARQPYDPHLYVMDDLRHRKTSAAQVPPALGRLGLESIVTFLRDGFSGGTQRLPVRDLDFVWFDCGGAGSNGVRFLEEYWPLVKPGGIVAMHSLHVALPAGGASIMVPTDFLNELARLREERGRAHGFEILSIVESHKIRQGDVTFIRKLGPLDAIRAGGLDEDSTSTLRTTFAKP